MTRNFTLKARALIAIPMDESGIPSILVGYALESRQGDRMAFYPRYGEQIQIVELLCEKEDYKYPKGEGRHMLLHQFMRLGIFHKTVEIIEDAQLPRKYNLLPIIKTEEDLESWLKGEQ